MPIQRDEKEIKKELEALERLTSYPEYQVFINVLDRLKNNCIEEIMKEGTSENKEDYILGRYSIFKGLLYLPEDIKQCTNENIRGKANALNTIISYLKDVSNRLFRLLKQKEKEAIKEDFINDSSLQT